ncbi:MAG: chromate transporter [Acutalibacteraceae bacterium]
MIFLELFARFFLVGLFSVGGGLATLPFLTDLGETTGWFGSADISNMIAISESTPGPLGINMATYVGFQVGDHMGTAFGFLGSLIATLGLITPSIIVIIIISKVLVRFRDSKYVEFAFYGLRAASVGLITAACLGVAKTAFYHAEALTQTGSIFMAVDYRSILLSALIFICVTKFKKIHPIVFIVAAAAVGIIFKL